MSLLNDKTAVVTGAGRGIGRAVAIAYAKMGAKVVCVSRTEENSAKVAAEIEALGQKAWAFAVDVSNSNAVETASKDIFDTTGKIDILVNNAGVTRDNLLMRMSEEEWDTVLNTNLKGADLKGANLRYTTGLTKDQIESALIDKNTLLPSYLKIKWKSEKEFECHPVEKKND